MVEEEGKEVVMERPSQEQIQQLQLQQQKQPLKCPRCESTNTKFCYYNNYSLTQPRHFCKACKRYWTRGGTLRSVPVGGGCRKNKRVRRPLPPPLHFNSATATTTTSNASSNNTSDPSNTFPSHSLNPSTAGIGSGGPHFINNPPMLYHADPLINGFPFSSYDNHHHQQHQLISGLGLGFSSPGMNPNGFSSSGASTRQILQDLISNSIPSSLVSPFHGSSNTNTTSPTTTMSMSSLLTSSLQNLQQQQQQQKLSFESSLFPYELDLQIKGVGSHGDGMKMEGDEDHPQPHQSQVQNGNYEIHDHQPMGSESEASMLWNTHGSSIGVNWLDPNYSSIGSSSVPSLI